VTLSRVLEKMQRLHDVSYTYVSVHLCPSSLDIAALVAVFVQDYPWRRSVHTY